MQIPIIISMQIPIIISMQIPIIKHLNIYVLKVFVPNTAQYHLWKYVVPSYLPVISIKMCIMHTCA